MFPAFYNAAVLREPYSGVEVTVHGLACALSRYGKLPLHVCVPTRHRPIPAAPHLTVRTVRLARARLGRILWEQTLLPILLRRERASLLHAPAYVAPLAAPCPVALTVHDLHVMTHPGFCSLSNRLHYRLFIPPSVRQAAAILVFSPHTFRVVSDRYPEVVPRMALIPPGLSPSLVRCAAPDRLNRVRQRYRLPPRFLLFVSDLERRKNVAGLLKSFACLADDFPDLHLALAGSAAPAAAAALDRAAQDLGLRDRVLRTGYVDVEDLPVVYSLAEQFVFPSHDEGFGLPPLEAMACGCPVVCSGGATSEICAEAAMICDPGDPASIEDAIRQLLRDPVLRRQKIAAGARLAATFGWEQAAKKTEAVYRAVINRQPVSEAVTGFIP